MQQSEQERHNIGHMKYLCERATDESSEVCFDYTLVQDVLNQFERMGAEIKRLKSREAILSNALLPLARWYTHPGDKPTERDCDRAVEALRGSEQKVKEK